MTALPDSMQRGACPALSTPMMTGDGLLARISLEEAISPDQLAQLGQLALQHGNGMVDISARGNLQIRGLSEMSAPRLDADVRAMNLPLRDGVAVEVPPLAGLDGTEVADPQPLALAIRNAARGMTGLAPKLAVVVDGGGLLRLSDLLADIRLVAVDKSEWRLLLGGTENSGRVFNVLRETLIVDTVAGLLKQLQALGNKARGRDLASGLATNGNARSPASPFDLFRLSAGLHAVGVGPAFGQIDADRLIALCNAAAGLGIEAFKPALDHSLIAFGSEASCQAFQGFAGKDGFITSASDPRSHIAACPGSPACNSATIATHEIAARAAVECDGLLDGSFKLHVSGCPKGCAHPQQATLALSGGTDGVSLIAKGKAADKPFAFSSFADTNTTLRHLSALVSSERLPGENSAACLARIGSDRLAAAATGRP